MSEIKWEETKYGFTWGGLTFQRLISHEGRVVARIGGVGTKGHIDVSVSPAGRSVRVFPSGVRVKQEKDQT